MVESILFYGRQGVLKVLHHACGSFVKLAVLAGNIEGNAGFLQIGKAELRTANQLLREACVRLRKGAECRGGTQEISLRLCLFSEIGAVGLLIILDSLGYGADGEDKQNQEKNRTRVMPGHTLTP
jgi:hypothetical protein